MSVVVKAAALVAALMVLSLSGCPKPVPPPVTPDAADAALPARTCAEACDNLRRLACTNADACDAYCPRVLRPSFRACLATAASCDEATRCDQ